ncbi:PepSY domain-containing protein [Faecalimonas sp. LCP19S3_D12]
MKKRYIGMITGGAAVAVVLIGGVSAYAIWNQRDIGEEQAKQIAYKDAGISEKDVDRVHILKDRDDGRYVYEIGFVESTYQHDYEIAASNGKILSKEVEQVEFVQNRTGNLQQGQQGTQEQANMNEQQTAQTNINGRQTVQVSIESATQMVLDKVPGATSDQLRINLDYDDGISKYEGELRYEGFEYDFEIDASSGTFLEWAEEKQDLWD